MSIKDLVKADIENLDVYLANFGGSMVEIQSILFQKVLALLESLPQKNGRLFIDDDVNKLILNFEKKLLVELNKTGYNSEITGLVKQFDKLEDIKKELSIAANPDLKAKILKAELNPIKKGYAETLTRSLGQKETFGLNVINPLRSIIYEHAVLGLSVGSATKRLFDVALSDKKNGGILARYAGQVAHDALFGYTGSIDQGIGKAIKAENIRYLGDLVRDSRPQCVRWVVKYNGFIPADKVNSEIAWAKKNGEGYSKHLPTLSKETFSVVRGGHNCRHRALWVTDKRSKAQEDISNEYDRQGKELQEDLEKKLEGRAKELYEANKKIVDEKVKKYGK